MAIQTAAWVLCMGTEPNSAQQVWNDVLKAMLSTCK